MSAAEQQTALLLHRRMVQLFYRKLVRASAWLFVGGILGYVFPVLMGRMLSTQEYGLFNAMVAILTVVAAPSSNFSMVVSRKVSEYRAKQVSGRITHFYFSINIRSAIVGSPCSTLSR